MRTFLTRIRAALGPVKTEPTARIVVNMDQGLIRTGAVAAYMAGMAAQHRAAFDACRTHAEGDHTGYYEHAARMHQAGAAACECMSELLLAAVVADREGFKRQFNAFVNDAIEGGVVEVG